MIISRPAADEEGQRAVAEVILHRLAEGGHGHTICNVVYEGVGQTFCQFTFACDGSLQQPKVSEPWRAAQVLAARLMAGEVPPTAPMAPPILTPCRCIRPGRPKSCV